MARNRAFEVLYREFYARVFGLCRRLLNSPELAEDATQETFMRAYKNFEKFDAEQPFWQWIATIANNHCLDKLRARHRTEHLFGDESEELENLTSTESSQAHRLIATEDIAALNNAVIKLSDKYRVPLVLVYYNQLSYDEVAKQLSIIVSHVGVLLLRAKKQVRAALEAANMEHGS
ncbi:MAG: sigma-70 family RNA polymerase sigma factor [Pseudomonadales bacterium]|jgi:RNA polymerase sigma-70 factor (ECF subfamily)|nr:sigma-70 family RNA polymerase sigma factor [Pseudomonadales bacterium]